MNRRYLLIRTNSAITLLLTICTQAIAQHPLDTWVRRTVPTPNSALNSVAYGNGTFVVPEDVPAVAANTPGAVEFVLAGDFNGDGVSDIATIFDVMNNVGDLTVALNNGSGTFASAMITGLKIPFVNSGAAADLNHDAKLDVMVTNGSAIAVPDSNIHSPNERMRLRNLEWALSGAHEIYRSLADLLRK